MNLEKQIKLKEQERITRIIRRYGLTLFWWWLTVFIFIVLPFFFMFWLFNHGVWGQILFITPLILGILLLIRILFVWQKNILVITTHRIIDIDQRGFFDQVISNVMYDQVEDVMGRIKGFFGTIFRYGHVNIQSGNGKVQVMVDRIKQPVFVQQEIMELRDKYMSKYVHDFSDDVAEVIIDKLYELDLPELLRVRKTLRKRMKVLEAEENSENDEREEI